MPTQDGRRTEMEPKSKVRAAERNGHTVMQRECGFAVAELYPGRCSRNGAQVPSRPLRGTLGPSNRRR